MKFLDNIYKFLFVKKPSKKDFSILINGPVEKRPMIGDILLFKHDSIISDTIENFSKGEVSHSALYVGGGERKIIEATENGVECNILDDYFNDEYSIIIRRITNLTVEKAEIMKNYAYSRVGKKYDNIQLLTYGIYYILEKLGFRDPKVVVDNSNKDICSELVSDAAKAAGYTLTKKNVDPSPQDLLVSKSMITVIEV